MNRAALDDHDLILAALNRAVRQALIEHKRAGNSIATWKDGKVVWIPAEEIEIPPEPDGNSKPME